MNGDGHRDPSSRPKRDDKIKKREREDRYGGRDRREDRGGWADRPPREDRRRSRSPRGGRRDRDGGDDRRRDRGDVFGDRRGGGGGGGGGGGRDRNDRGGGDNRKKSASPPPKKREPTPDLTNVVSVLDRVRSLTQWDIKPPGYENVTSEQAKMSGMFPLPGAPRQQQMDPQRLQAFINQPGNQAAASALKPSQARQSKRLFVYNVPAAATNDSLVEFFNLQLNGLNVIAGNDPCLSAAISTDRSYALLEFKNPNDATVALALNGITMEATDGGADTDMADASGLSIRRPKDYISPTSVVDPDAMEGVISPIVKDSPNKLCISHIPIHMTEEQIKEILEAMGPLSALVLVTDVGSEQSRGFAFCEYSDPSKTEIALEGLNGLELGDDHLKVERASVGHQQAQDLQMNVGAMSILAGQNTGDLEKGRVLELMNMVTIEELMDGEEYDDIKLEVQDECDKYGKVIEIKIPRPAGARSSPGVGKIYVKFEQPESAAKALAAMSGRKFSDRTVVVTYFGEEYFDTNAW
ncbi:hypothetical protein EG328_011554 [Venturia inaequalis]|uniref:Splicing factor U2AF subunit n=1 Tax=Venturia inaequalis TaxID=5025 RepID=A0A8H3V5R4_VENIN|nr:hypothetical protein EG328_011554 [Venturia inaequalis]